MLNPGSKGWVNKYLSMVRKGDIRLQYNLECGTTGENKAHMLLGGTGIIFGVYSHFIFIQPTKEDKWTKHEQLKVLYLESLLFVYTEFKNTTKIDTELFSSTLTDFFEAGGSREVRGSWLDFLRFSKLNPLEEAINKRTQIPLSFDHKIWVSYLQNSLCFIDVLLFRIFLTGESDPGNLQKKRTIMSEAALQVIILASHADGFVATKERSLFDLFLASADFSEEERLHYITLFKSGASIEDIEPATAMPQMFKRYLLDLAIFTVWSDTDFSEKEYTFLQDLATYLNFSEDDLNESFSVVENFVLKNHDIIPYLKGGNSYDKVVSRLGNHWSKVILRNKDRLTKEIRESKELVELVRKSAVVELSGEEKEKVKSQFMDIIKSVPALAIFMLPGGAILLPLILKVIPTLIPSAFRDNEIDEDTARS